MKRINYFLSLAAIALLIGFNSCEETEDALGPEIILAGGDYISSDVIVEPGADLSFRWTVTAGDAKLESFSIIKNNAFVPGWADFEIPNDQNENFISEDVLTADQNEGVYTYLFIATDRDGLADSTSVNVTVEIQTTPLSDPSQFVLTYKGSSQTDGENVNETLGVEYASNISATEARIEVVASKGNVFVMLSEAEANAIDTQEALKETYDSMEASGVTSFTAQSDALFADKWFATKVNDVYYWVHMTDLQFAAGNNRAFFDYKN